MKKIIVSLLLFTHGIMLPASEGHTTQPSYFVIPPAITPNHLLEESNSGDYSLESQIQPDEYTAVSTPATAPNHLAESDLVSNAIAYQQINQGHTLFLQATTASACDSGLDLLASLAIQTKKQKKLHQCKICGMTSSSPGQLLRHMRTHTGEKPYPCNYCEKAFRTSGHRARHETMHTGIKRYKCSFCEQGFDRKTNIDEHIRIHTGVKPYPCRYCEKKFTRNYQRSSHEKRIHSKK